MFHNHSRQSSDRIIHLFHKISDCHLLPCYLSYPTIILLTSCRVVTVRPFGAPLQASVMRIVRLGSDTMEPGFYPHHQKIIILNLSYRKPLNPCKITMCCWVMAHTYTPLSLPKHLMIQSSNRRQSTLLSSFGTHCTALLLFTQLCWSTIHMQ